MKTFKQYIDEKGRCWPGHKPVPGKKPFSPGSCVKEETQVEDIYEGTKLVNDGSIINVHHNGKHIGNIFSSTKTKDTPYKAYSNHWDMSKLHKSKKAATDWLVQTHQTAIKESSAAAIAAATAISKKKSGNYDSKGFRKTAYKNPNNPNVKSNEQRRKELAEDLRKWFAQKWVRMDTKGNIKGHCARDPGEGKPKCLPQAKAQSLGKEGRAAAARRKRREDPNPERRGAPINVRTK